MNIVYIGVVDFSYYCLEVLLELKANVTGIVTLSNPGNNSDFRDITPLSIGHNIPIYYSDNINSVSTIEWIREKGPDIIFCWGISQLIKEELLSLPPMGILGVHPALLPANRGRHPIIWALALGLKKSGLSFFFMDKGADSGPILSQKEFEIDDKDDAGSLYNKLKVIARQQITEFLPKLESNSYEVTIQNENEANYWRKRRIKDGIISWSMSCNAIINLIRALSKPYPGAEASFKTQPVKIWNAERYRENVNTNIEPGKIIKKYNGLPVVKCYDGAIILKEYEPGIVFSEGDYFE